MLTLNPFRLSLPDVNYLVFGIKLDPQWLVGIMKEVTFNEKVPVCLFCTHRPLLGATGISINIYFLYAP